MRRLGQTRSAVFAVLVVTLPHTARQLALGVPSVLRTTPRVITDAPSRGAGRGGVARVHTGRPSALVVRPHEARTNACAAKRTARQVSRGWKALPPQHRGRGAKVPKTPGRETPIAQDGREAGEVEVEARIEPSPEEMEE